MKNLHLLIIIVVCLNLTACAARVVKPLGASEMPVDAIAKIRPFKDSWPPGFADIMDLSRDAKNNEWISIGNSFSGHSRMLDIKPGRYHIVVICQTGHLAAYPSAIVVVEAGKYYGSRCINHGNSKIGVEFIEATPQEVRR